jgi:hypothetical protein
VGVYRGLRFGLVLHPRFTPEVYLEGAATRQTMLNRDHHGPRAVLNALERLAGGYGHECDRVRQELSIAENQLRDYRARLGTPFTHDADLAELTALRDQLRGGLSGAPPETGAETKPGVAELAERIQALKAAHAIEAAPERSTTRRSVGERPVTARLRRPAEAVPRTKPEREPEAAEPRPALPATPAAAPTADPLPASRPHSARILAGTPRQRSLF